MYNTKSLLIICLALAGFFLCSVHSSSSLVTCDETYTGSYEVNHTITFTCEFTVSLEDTIQDISVFAINNGRYAIPTPGQNFVQYGQPYLTTQTITASFSIYQWYPSGTYVAQVLASSPGYAQTLLSSKVPDTANFFFVSDDLQTPDTVPPGINSLSIGSTAADGSASSLVLNIAESNSGVNRILVVGFTQNGQDGQGFGSWTNKIPYNTEESVTVTVPFFTDIRDSSALTLSVTLIDNASNSASYSCTQPEASSGFSCAAV